MYMKKSTLILGLFFLIAPIVLAETITTGSSSVNTSITTNANDGQVRSSINVQSTGDSEVRVENKVESSTTSTTTSNTYKKIEVNVNGEKKIVESNQPGEIRVDINTNSITKAPTPTKSASPSATPTPQVASGSASTSSLGEQINKIVSDFIKNLFEKIF